jgi:methyl farnesoate epoxidase/farnesoate epoxidase
MVFTILLFTVLGFLALALYIRRVTKWDKPPPGPDIHPFLGSFPTLAKLDPVPYRAWHSLTDQFGPLVRLVMGLNNMLIIGGYEEMKEALNNEMLDDRGISPTSNIITFGSETSEEISLFSRAKMPKNVTVNPVDKWKELRRFTMKSLKDLGFGKSASEEAILDESKTLIRKITEAIEGTDGEINLEKTLNCAALNIIWNLVAGKRFSYDDPLMKQLVDMAGNLMLIRVQRSMLFQTD